MTEPLITPAMKVAALLEAFPALEDVLVAQAPAFERLRNPVLRRTVARVATLEQAAAIAGLSTRDLVTTLRRAAGQPIDDPATGPSSAEAGEDEGPVPAWIDPARVRRVIDADAILASGASPLTTVFEAARALDADEVLEVTVSFRPVPLVESLGKQGYACHVRATGGRFSVYVKKQGQTLFPS
jgi:hypothetical protein